VKDSGEFTCISDISDYWDNLYKSNENAINAYSGMETLDIMGPGMVFVLGIQYDLLNLYNEDGHFEGDLMFAGYKAFIDKNGSELSFGYDDVMEKDGFTADSKTGDKKVQNGSCDLTTGHYFSDEYTDRAGTIISRESDEFLKLADGSMCALIIDGDTVNYNNEEALNRELPDGLNL
jgi:hypothetical protein